MFSKGIYCCFSKRKNVFFNFLKIFFCLKTIRFNFHFLFEPKKDFFSSCFWLPKTTLLFFSQKFFIFQGRLGYFLCCLLQTPLKNALLSIPCRCLWKKMNRTVTFWYKKNMKSKQPGIKTNGFLLFFFVLSKIA